MLLISNFILSYNCGITIHRSPAIIPRNNITVIITEHVLEAFLAFFLVFMSLSSNKVRNNLSKTPVQDSSKSNNRTHYDRCSSTGDLTSDRLYSRPGIQQFVNNKCSNYDSKNSKCHPEYPLFLSSDIFSLPQLKYFYAFL